jgi:ABC-type sugar transport system permease subunit
MHIFFIFIFLPFIFIFYYNFFNWAGPGPAQQKKYIGLGWAKSSPAYILVAGLSSAPQGLG